MDPMDTKKIVYAPKGSEKERLALLLGDYPYDIDNSEYCLITGEQKDNLLWCVTDLEGDYSIPSITNKNIEPLFEIVLERTRPPVIKKDYGHGQSQMIIYKVNKEKLKNTIYNIVEKYMRGDVEEMFYEREKKQEYFKATAIISQIQDLTQGLFGIKYNNTLLLTYRDPKTLQTIQVPVSQDYWDMAQSYFKECYFQEDNIEKSNLQNK